MNIRMLLLTLLIPFFAAAQFLAPDTPLQQAYTQATQQDKLIFLMVESADCRQCNEVASKAFQNDTLKNYIRENFIAIRIPAEHPDLSSLKEKYHSLGGNSVLFLDKWSTLLFRMNISTTDHKRYIAQAKNALARKAEADQLRALEADALAGKLATGQLYELIHKRKALTLPIDALLDQYVSQLPEDSLNSISTIKRIAKLSPILRSKADSAMRKNAALFNQTWNSLNLSDRAIITQDITFKTRQQAIAEKNLSKAREAAQFARSSGNDKARGDKAYYYTLMEFFKNTNDTTAYLRSAVDFYERLLKDVNAAEIKKQDSTRKALFAQKQSSSRPARDTAGLNGHIILRSTYNITESTNYSQLLNNGARSFYNMTKDPAYLKKALQWAAYANQFYENPYVLDTWARLMYKVDKKNAGQAIQLEEKSIALLTTQGFPTDKNNEVLNRMKKNEIIR